MIAFSTLLLGLLLGPQTVELTVGDGVARVELRLDGEPIAELTGAPWRADCDFGETLRPHELLAVAFDRHGQELARIRQGINLPHDPAAASLGLEGPSEARVARLAWESTAGAEPAAVRVSFDGRPLEVDDPRHIVLPPHDDAQPHFLRAELDFGEAVTSVAEVSFGGLYAGAVTAEMTALPILADPSPSVGDLQGSFTTKDGRELVVKAVEKGPAEVVMVVDRAYRGDLFQITSELWRRRRQRVEDLRFRATLADAQRLRFVDAVAEERQGTALEYRLFPISRAFSPAEGGVYFLLARQRWTARGVQRLADAVAVAGVTAAGHRRRRAVVLVLSREPHDASRFTPGLVRRYLGELRVPLHVFSPRASPAADDGWGERTDISTLGRLERAVRRLSRELEAQRIVWLDGHHLPRDVALRPGARGVRLVAASP